MWDKSDFSLSQGFKNKLFFELLFPFVMRISVLQFGAASSFWERTEPDSLWSPSLLLGWLGSSWRMNVLPGQPLCCFSCTPSREWETKDVLRAPAEHSCPAEWSYFWIFFCLKYPLCHFPTFIHMYVNRLAVFCMFSSAAIPTATGALLHNAVWHCSSCFYLQCLINM